LVPLTSELFWVSTPGVPAACINALNGTGPSAIAIMELHSNPASRMQTAASFMNDSWIFERAAIRILQR
jgi:hypothetical protein